MSNSECKKIVFFLTNHIRYEGCRFAKVVPDPWDFSLISIFYELHLIDILSDFQKGNRERFKAILEDRIQSRPDCDTFAKGFSNRDVANIEDDIPELFSNYDYRSNPCLNEFIEQEYKKHDRQYNVWTKLYSIKDSEKQTIYCALNDYTLGDSYKKEFFKQIVDGLKKRFGSDMEYYLFIHGSSLIDDGYRNALVYYPGDKIEELGVCPKNFRVKTFHHQMCYDEYRFLIDPMMGDLLLELLFVNNDAKKIICALKEWLDELLLDPLNFEPTDNPLKAYLELKNNEGVAGGFVANYDEDFAKKQIFNGSTLCEMSEPESIKKMGAKARLELATEIYRRSHALKLKLGWK